MQTGTIHVEAWANTSFPKSRMFQLATMLFRRLLGFFLSPGVNSSKHTMIRHGWAVLGLSLFAISPINSA